MPADVTSPQDAFKTGIEAYRKKEFKDAVENFNTALEQTNEPNIRIKILDSRAAAKEQLQDFKGALADAKKVIDLCPQLPKVLYHFSVT